MDNVIGTLGLFLLSLVLLYAGTNKVYSYGEVKANFEISFGFNQQLSLVVTSSLILLELLLGSALLFVCLSKASDRVLMIKPYILWLNTSLFFGFLSVAFYSLITKSKLKCNCFGETKEIEPIDLVRNFLLFIFSIFVVVTEPVIHFHFASVICFIVAISLLLITVNLKSIVALFEVPG